MENKMVSIKELIKKEKLTKKEKDYIVKFFLDNVKGTNVKFFARYNCLEAWLCVNSERVLLLKTNI